MNTKIIIMIISVVCIIVIASFFIFVYNGSRDVRIPMNSKQSFTFGLQILDTDGGRLRKTITIQNNEYSGTIQTQGIFSSDTTFDVILLNNFKQIGFSLNNNGKSICQTVTIPKTPENKMMFAKYNLYIGEINDGINDLLVIFKRKPNAEDLKSWTMNIHQTVYVTRFSIVKNKLSDQHIEYNREYTALDGNPFDNIFIYDKEFKSFNNVDSNGVFNFNTLNNIKGKPGDKIKLPISINTMSALQGTFLDMYRNSKDKNERIAVFALVDNKITPLYYNSVERTEVFYEKDSNKAIMITPEIELQNGYKTLTFIAVNYPLTEREQFNNTYRIAQWNNCLISNEILIELL